MNEQKNVSEMTGEELAMLIQQQYELFMQSKNNIMIIQQELAKRKQDKDTAKKEST